MRRCPSVVLQPVIEELASEMLRLDATGRELEVRRRRVSVSPTPVYTCSQLLHCPLLATLCRAPSKRFD